MNHPDALSIATRQGITIVIRDQACLALSPEGEPIVECQFASPTPVETALGFLADQLVKRGIDQIAKGEL